ncbi:MAG: hypothetical protein ACKV2U_09505 [Bryobacteraceae bacterium]
MSKPASRAVRSEPASVQAAIEAFLALALQPVLQEPGELPFPMETGQFELAQKAGALLVSTWDETRQLHRRAIAIAEDRPGRLTLTIERFGGKLGMMVLYDESKPASAPLRKQGERHHFREQLRSLLRKQFPGWRLLDLSADLDLEHSLSANYPRALLRRGQRGLAVIGAAPGPPEPALALTYGLIWLDYLRRREPNLIIDTLALFLPPLALTATALRIKWLTGAQFRLFTYTAEGQSQGVDPADCGNLHTELLPAQLRERSPLHPDVEVTGISAKAGRGTQPTTTSSSHPTATESVLRESTRTLRLRGLEVPACSPNELSTVIAEMARLRSPEAPDRLNPLYTRRAEAWLEAQLRRHLDVVDATLQPAPLYGQVIAVAGVDRGIADVLAVDYDGRLAVLEIKAEEDIHLPLQALDYWMRIAHHAAQGDFRPRNYFPGIALRPDPPRLLLVAPALSFHPTTETILGFFSSNIAVERVGLALEWRQMVRVLFRYRGAVRPT